MQAKKIITKKYSKNLCNDPWWLVRYFSDPRWRSKQAR